MSLFCSHDWHVALGTSNGIIGGKPRLLNVDMFCPKCKRHQYIENFSSRVTDERGRFYVGKPVYTEGHVENLSESEI